MRRRLAVALIAGAGLAGWFWFLPDAPADDLPTRLASVTPFPRDLPQAGGLSGLEVTADGIGFYVVSDRGHIAKGSFSRTNGEITGISVEDLQMLVDDKGKADPASTGDAEGLALDASGRVYVSFEQNHRVHFYETWASPAEWPSYTLAWRALAKNKGLEALAVDPAGTLYTIPEGMHEGATQALVYRRHANAKWQQAFTIPVDESFLPVGADIGPDGRFYLLERGLYPFGFYSRVRRMEITDTGFKEISTVMQSRLGTHGNLEGLSVWRDSTGTIRLTMVSDDNFLPFMRSEIVEYILDEGLAPAKN